MNQLVIIGASAMGRETCVYARECGMEVRGFLDSRKGIMDDYPSYPPVLSSAEDYTPTADDVFLCALGEPEQKKRYVEMISIKRGKFATVIHPRSYIGSGVTIGEGSIIAPNATITTDVILGKHTTININSSINHDCTIGDYVTLSPGCNIAGWCKLGREAFMGVHSACLPHVVLGDRVYVAAGAVVTKSVESGRVMGIPARIK